MADKPRRKPATDDDGPNYPRRSEFIDEVLAKRRLMLAPAWRRLGLNRNVRNHPRHRLREMRQHEPRERRFRLLL